VLKKVNKKLVFILVLAFLLRLYRVNNPVADWHAFRQADTASVTREYQKAEKIDLLRPQYHDLSNIQSGQDNLEGYRMVEFPFVNAGIAIILKTFPFLDLVIFSRLVSIFASLGTIICLYYLVKEISGNKLALLTALIYAILPYSIYYSRVILPEPFFLLFSTLSLWQFLLYLKDKKLKSYLISVISLALAALLKPFVVFLAPVYLAILWQFGALKNLKDWKIYLYPVLAFIPLLLWRNWITNFPTGIPASDWLLNGNGIRLRPAWFRWLFYERLSKLFLGYFGIVFLLTNLLKKNKEIWIYAAWWLGILLYLVVIATGNVQHDYYQNMLLPILAISVARGFMILSEKLKKTGKIIAYIFLALSIIFAWQQVKGYFNVNHWEYVEAGKAVDLLTDKNAKVIAPAMGDTIFLFQTNRRGWPIGFEIDDKIAKGAEIYVSSSYDDEARELEKEYQTIEKTDKYLILDLRKPLE
jgi:hypothetical protein